MQSGANGLLPWLDIASLPETIRRFGLLGSRGRAEARENSAVVETAAQYACINQKSIPFGSGPEASVLFQPSGFLCRSPIKGQSPNQTNKSNEPAREGQINEYARNNQQRRKIESLRELNCADRVHTQRKDHAPVLRIVA